MRLLGSGAYKALLVPDQAVSADQSDKVVMVADANGARYPEDHLAGLTSFYQSFGDVRTTDEVVDQLLSSRVAQKRAATSTT